VERQQRSRCEQHVAHAEHVRPRPAGGDREDVAEEGEPRALDEVGVRERAAARGLQPGGRQRPGRGGHDAAVRRDCREVERAAKGDEPGERQVEVPREAGPNERVGHEVRPAVEGLAAIRQQRHEHDLYAEGEAGQPHRPQPELSERAQPAARERNGGEDHDEDEREGHSPTSSSPGSGALN